MSHHNPSITSHGQNGHTEASPGSNWLVAAFVFFVGAFALSVVVYVHWNELQHDHATFLRVIVALFIIALGCCGIYASFKPVLDD